MGRRKGCKDDRHGMSRTRLYRTWQSMLVRCGYRAVSNPMAFTYYINKGITVCPEWHTFRNFAAWAMANGHSDELTLDRIDSNGHYEPNNCQWITMTANLRKRSGVKMTMEKAEEVRRRKAAGERAEDLAIEFGINSGQIYRICEGVRWKVGVA